MVELPAPPQAEGGESGGRAFDSRTAILLINFQNEFAKPGGKLHDGVASVMEHTEMLKKVPDVVRAARESEALVIHSSLILKAGEKASATAFDQHSYASIDGLFVEGSWNAEFADETKPAENDVIIKNRKSFCAFTGTELKSILERNKIERMFIMGFLTNMGIEETVIELSENMPEIAKYVLIDGCAANSKQEHYAAIGSSLPTHSTLVTCAETDTLLRKPSPPSPRISEALRKGINERPNLKVRRPRILALHGARSNDKVTKLQLENLCITEEEYDIVYLHGPIEVEEGDPEHNGLVYGPFYSWLDEDEKKCGASLITAVRDVLTVAKKSGPFDGIYGFSSGGHVAAFAAAIATDPSLLQAIKSLEADGVARRGASLSRRSLGAVASMMDLAGGGLAGGGNNGKLKSGANGRLSGRKTVGFSNSFTGRRSAMSRAAPEVKDGDFVAPPFRFAVLACSASSTPDVATLRKYAGLRPIQLKPGSMATKSFHLIGIEDGFKAQSEEIATLFAERHVKYLPGGHTVSSDERSDEELCLSLRIFMHSLGSSIRGSLGSPPIKVPLPSFLPKSEVTPIAERTN